MRKRPKIVSLVAGWLVLCSVVGVVVFSITIPTVDTIQMNGSASQWIVERMGRGGLLGCALLLYGFAGTLGFGLWKLRAWARLGALLASIALVGTSLISGIVTVVKAHELDINSIVLMLIFGWPLYYFNRPKIKALFT